MGYQRRYIEEEYTYIQNSRAQHRVCPEYNLVKCFYCMSFKCSLIFRFFVSVMVHCSRRGTEAIVGDLSHTFLYEQGKGGFLCYACKTYTLQTSNSITNKVSS